MQLLEANVLSKAYLHKAPFTHELTAPVQLEIAKLVFYFSEQPIVHSLSSDDKEHAGWKHEVYVFSDAVVDAACRNSLKEIAQTHDHYRIACTEINEPKKSVKIDLYYNPQEIMCCYDAFDAITNHKGIVFRLVNKTLLNHLAQKEHPLIQMASAHRPMVIIDCGHGGKEPGAIGCNGIAEKDITLAVGLQLEQLLKEKQLSTYLTRSTDATLPLDVRTAFINTKRPDLYISIHANSSVNKSVKGLETFCLSQNLFSPLCDTDSTVSAYLKELYTQSNRLGNKIHQHLLVYVNKQEHQLSDRKVRHSVPQLLLGTNTPGALIEIGYLSHVDEAAQLSTKTYQHKIAQGICSGIMAYLTA